MNEISEKRQEDEGLTTDAFLLRFWQENKGEPMRFMLRSVKTDERLLFSSRDDMFTYLDNYLKGKCQGNG